MNRRKRLLTAAAFVAATMLGGVTASAQDKIEWNWGSIQPPTQPFMSITDAYQAMQRNAVRDFSGSAASIMADKLFEVMKSGVMTNGQSASGTVLVREAALDKPPEDIRKIHDEEMATPRERLDALTAASPNMVREAPGRREQKGHGHESSFDV